MADDKSKNINDDEIIVTTENEEVTASEGETVELDSSAHGESPIQTQVLTETVTTNNSVHTTDKQVHKTTEKVVEQIEVPVQFESDSPPKKSLKKLILIVLLLMLIVAAASEYSVILVKKATPNDTGSLPAPVAKKEENNNELFKVTKLSNGDIQIDDRIWFAKPIKLDPTKYNIMDIASEKYEYSDGAGPKTEYNHIYYQVGKKTDGTEIIQLGPNNIDSEQILVTAKDGKFQIIKKHSFAFGKDLEEKYYPTISEDSTIDQQTEYPELVAPEELTLKGKKFTLMGEGSTLLIDENKSLQNYEGTIYGSVSVEQQENTSKSHRTERYTLQRYDFRTAYYQPDPNIVNIEKGSLTFQDGSNNTNQYSTGFHGCNFGGSFHDILTDDDELVEGIRDNKGNTYYSLKTDSSTPRIIQETLDNYNEVYSDKKLTTAELLKKKPVIIYKNGLGQKVVIYNDEVIAAGGCGKPVIYLYPQQTISVNVKVGADIRLSEPAYGDGWNVIAQPNGLISMLGKTYDSLFWEGYSKYYPEFGDEGFVVRQKDITTTMTNHLTQLGLNQKERSDFMSFWLPKMPKTPYVRLTWFRTQTVDKIAPLDISPKPDTAIRIFLDFEGLNNRVSLNPQHLTSVPRKGFTVVEWGGLLKEPIR